MTATATIQPTPAIPPGYRGLSAAFLDDLEALARAPEGGWWRDMLARPDLVLAVRAGYLNVYYRGAALYLIGQRQGRIVASTHARYLVRQRQGSADLSADGAFALDPDQALWRHYAGPQTLGEMLRAAAHLAGPEKDGVHDLVLASPRVVDVEISLSAAAPQATRAGEALGGTDPSCDPKASRQDRIDVATLTEREGKAFVSFHEAKHFTNPELRAGPTRKPPVVAQIERYRATLTHHASQLSLSYQAVARALVRLDRLRQEVTGPGTTSRLDPLVIRVAEDPVPPAIDTEPRLVVFDFDEDQRDGSVWGRHRTRLAQEFGLQVYAVGSTRGRRHAAFR